MVMGVMMDRKQSLASLASEVTIYPQVLKNVRVADKTAAKENPAVQEAVKTVAERLGAVSYTHLDVYKRQRYDRGRFWKQ